tara:strand:+ start:88 stop:948 length:861 start_codon:yes stop_codon:yes gene_type:complete
MKCLITLFLLLSIGTTLWYFNKKEHFNNRQLDIQTNQIPSSNQGLAVFSSSTSSIENMQRNQHLIFKLFMKEVETNNEAKEVLLMKEKDIYPFQFFVQNVDEMEVNLKNKITKKADPMCTDFLVNYCIDEQNEPKSDPSLYNISNADFVNKLDHCFDVCFPYDIEDIRKYRKLLYNTLFDIFLRFGVLEKAEGDINDETNKDKYQYLINNNTEDSIMIKFDMGPFSRQYSRYEDFVTEIVTLIKIVNLTNKKLVSLKNIENDKKTLIKNNFVKEKYKRYASIDEES